MDDAAEAPVRTGAAADGRATGDEDLERARPASDALAGGSYTPDPNRWKALSVTLVAGFMTLLDVSIVSVALPSIRTGLHTSAPAIQWMVSGYALAFGLVLVAAGRLGDALGRRRMFLGSLAAFVVSSALVGLSPNALLLAVFRIMQGMAAGSLAPQNSALIQQLFRGAERGRAFGLFGSTVGISTAVGPLAGGAILALAGEANGWRWLFYINLPIGVLALVLAARFIPKKDSPTRQHIDVVGALLLGAAVLAALLPFTEAEDGGLRRLWWLFIGVPVFLAAFALWERRTVARGHDPLFDPRLVHTEGYGSGLLLGTVFFIGFSGIWLVFALFFQTGLGYSPLLSGLSVTAFALGSAGSAVIGGRLVGRLGRRLTVMGLTALIAGLGTTALLLGLGSGHHAGLLIALPMLVGGIGSGCVISPNITMTLAQVPVSSAGTAGGALQTGQRLGAAIGTALLTGVFYTVLTDTRRDYHRAVLISLLCAVGTVALAWVVAVVEWRRGAGREVRASH